MNEELLNLIQQLIASLQAEQLELQEGSVAWTNRDKAIKHFSSQLKVMTGEVSASVQQVSRLERQFRDLFSAINTGATTAGKAVDKLSVGGMQFRIPQFQRLAGQKSEPIPVSQPQVQQQEPVIYQPTQLTDFQVKRRDRVVKGKQTLLPPHIRQAIVQEAQSLLDELMSTTGSTLVTDADGNFKRVSDLTSWYRGMYDAQPKGRRSRYRRNVTNALRDVITGVENPKKEVDADVKTLILDRLTNGGGPSGADPGVLWYLGMKDEAAEAMHARGDFYNGANSNANLLETFGDERTVEEAVGHYIEWLNKGMQPTQLSKMTEGAKVKPPKLPDVDELQELVKARDALVKQLRQSLKAATDPQERSNYRQLIKEAEAMKAEAVASLNEAQKRAGTISKPQAQIPAPAVETDEQRIARLDANAKAAKERVTQLKATPISSTDPMDQLRGELVVQEAEKLNRSAARKLAEARKKLEEPIINTSAEAEVPPLPAEAAPPAVPPPPAQPPAPPAPPSEPPPPPTPPGDGDDGIPDDINERIIKAAEEQARAKEQAAQAALKQATINGVLVTEGNAELEAQQKATTAKKKGVKPPKEVTDEEINRQADLQARRRAANRERRAAEKAAELEEARVQRLAALENLGQSLPGGGVAAQNVFRRAEQVDRNFKKDTLRKIDTDPSTGISRLTFSYNTEEGVLKKTTFTVDKFGKVLVDTQKRFRAFGDAIARDISEVLKWSVAVAVVYGPMQKLGELMQVMVQNETALAEVTVTLGNAQRSTSEIFDAASDIAQEVGENMNDVLQAYNLAYRATGGMESATERFATTNKLLTDSITLSKLSTLEEAEAIDILAAALKQTSQPGETLAQTLSRGSELLNKWVAVSKVANVDLTTLATGFSVVGDAADAANIDTDQLNAVLATIAETSSMSGKEVANTAKAMVAGFQSDNARQAIANVGISYLKANGEAKNFLEISQEIAQLRLSGLINAEQFSKLTLAIGGGTRRSAPVATFIENLGKIPEIAAASQNATEATGEAMAALGIQTDTVQTATVRLGNAFQSLAQSVGEEGGVLDTFKGFLDLMTGITTALSDVMAVAGRAGPTLATSLAGLAFLRAQGPNFVPQMFSAIGTGAEKLTNKALLGGGGPISNALAKRFGAYNDISASYQGQTIGQQAGVFAQNAFPYAVSGLQVGSTALANFASGETAQGWGNIAGGTLGAVAGKAIGASFGTAMGGPVGAFIGATLGSAIAEGFVNAAESFKPEFQQLFSDIFEQEPPLPKSQQDKRAQLEKDTFDYIKKITGSDDLGGFTGRFENTLYNAAGSVSTFLKNLFTGSNDKFLGLTDAQSLLVSLEAQRRTGAVSEEEYQRALEMLRELNAPVANLNKQATAIQVKNQALLETLQKEQEDALRGQLITGDIGVAPYRRGVENLQGFMPTASQYMATFGQGQAPQDFLPKAARVISLAPDEAQEQLLSYVQAVSQLDTELSKLSSSSARYTAATAERNKAIQEGINYFEMLNRQILSTAQLMQSIDLSEFTDSEITMILQEAVKNFKEELDFNIARGILTQDEADAVIANLEKIRIEGEKTNMVFSGAPAEAINEAVAKLEKAQKISSKGLGFQTFDLPMSELQRITGDPYEQQKKLLESFGYKAEEENQIVLSNDGGVATMRKDWKIVQYLLQQILETEQKQLDGIYNLPDGSSFWIPVQAAKLYPQQGQTTMGQNQVTAPGPVTTTTVQPTQPVATPYQPPNLQQMIAQRFVQQNTTAVVPTPYQPPNLQQNIQQRFLQQNPPVAEKATFLDFLKGAILALSGPTINGIPTQGPNNSAANVDEMGLWTSIKDFLSVISGPNIPGFSASTSGQNQQSIFDLNSLSQIFSNLSTKLNLTIDNKTTIQLDGRVVAASIKRYLKDDLVKYSSGSSSRTMTII